MPDGLKPKRRPSLTCVEWDQRHQRHWLRPAYWVSRTEIQLVCLQGVGSSLQDVSRLSCEILGNKMQAQMIAGLPGLSASVGESRGVAGICADALRFFAPSILPTLSCSSSLVNSVAYAMLSFWFCPSPSAAIVSQHLSSRKKTQIGNARLSATSPCAYLGPGGRGWLRVGSGLEVEAVDGAWPRCRSAPWLLRFSGLQGSSASSWEFA